MMRSGVSIEKTLDVLLLCGKALLQQDEAHTIILLELRHCACSRRLLVVVVRRAPFCSRALTSRISLSSNPDLQIDAYNYLNTRTEFIA